MSKIFGSEKHRNEAAVVTSARDCLESSKKLTKISKALLKASKQDLVTTINPVRINSYDKCSHNFHISHISHWLNKWDM